MNFGEALEAVKSGNLISREGWNGKGMWLAYQKAYPQGIPINKNTAEATGVPEGTVCKFLPYLMMKTVDGSFVPWLASQTDVLAEDWGIVPKKAKRAALRATFEKALDEHGNVVECVECGSSSHSTCNR